MLFDIGVLASDGVPIDSFCDIARKLGITGLGTLDKDTSPVREISKDMTLYRRSIVLGNSISKVRKQIGKIRRKSVIVSVPLKSIEVTNWAAEDSRVDLLTVASDIDHRLRESTARLAAESNTSLEIQIAPLFRSSGLTRSKILKSYREAIGIAQVAGMSVVLTSGAKHPLELRSGVAMIHVGLLLGMERTCADNSVKSLPTAIIKQNLKKLQPESVRNGVELIREGM